MEIFHWEFQVQHLILETLAWWNKIVNDFNYTKYNLDYAS